MNIQFVSDINVGGGAALSLRDIRTLAKSDPAGFMARTTKLIEAKKITFDQFRDLRGLFAVLSDVKVPVNMDVMGIGQRSVMASAFPILTGNLVIAQINQAYNAIPTIGQELVTEIDDNKKVTTMASVYALDKNVEEVKELKEYPEIGAAEEKVEIRHKKNGRRLSISREAISENELPDIISRINALGEIASDWIEEQTLRRVTDHDGSASSGAEPYVYRPNGTGTALFSSTANTPGTRAPNGTRKDNNAFADETDLEAARILLASMKNDRGKRISLPWSEVKILVPDAIVGKVLKVFNSQYVPGVENEVSNWGPGGKWNLPNGRIISSPKMDDLSSSAWYMGIPQRQFVRKWKLRMEYLTLGADTESYLRRDVAFQARIAWDVEIGARDYVFWIQNLSGTTAPKDE
ncbi:MAG: hypothetical protein A4E65_02307 [Syntrophorhabdus sp. PtaU1.Bin153]|nr:MAG: hypothetical protein A4E65_02307 [Syntrophorhabdus sp. PtaU1.Bin153]